VSDKCLLREYFSLCPDGMCAVSRLNEAERQMKDGGYLILTGIIQSANKKNGNGRIYRRETLQREVEKYQEKIRQNRAVGTLDHEDSNIANLRNASHLVVRTWWDGDDVLGAIKVLKNTPSGQVLEGLVKDGVSLGISSRALGSLRQTQEGMVVEDDLDLICFDIVSDPSTPEAFMRVTEAIQKQEKNSRLNYLLDSVINKNR